MSDEPYAANGDEAVPSEQPISLDDRLALRNALDAVAVMQQPLRRGKVIDQLSQAMPDLAHVLGQPDVDTFDVLEACLRVDDGLEVLIIALKLVGGPSATCLAFEDLVNQLRSGTKLPRKQREALAEILAVVPPAAHAAAVTHGAFAGIAYLVGQSATAAEAFDLLLTVPGPEGALARLRYLELVSHQLDQARAIGLHRLIGHLVQRWPQHREAIEGLCLSLDPAHDSPAVSAGERSEPPKSGGNVRTVDGDGMITLTVRQSELAPSLATTTVWGGVPPRNRNFTGRDDLLGKIRDALTKATETTLVPQALYGLGGVGKSQLAIEFAHRFKDSYELIWWIPSDDERSIRRSLVSLAKRVGIVESADADDTIGAILDALRHGQPHARWLLIFDNAGDPDDLQPYRPADGPGHVLITSRSSKWIGQTEIVPVDVFEPEESLELLAKRWPSLDQDDAMRLADRLGHLPLALEQAAAVHDRTGMTLDEYMTALDETPYDVLAEGAPSGYGRSVAATFKIAYRELRARSEAAAQLLGVCSFLSSQPISIEILIRGRAAELPEPLAQVLRKDILRRKAVRDLGDHALAQLDPGRNLIKIHNLVRDLLREEIDEADRQAAERAAHGVLALANPGDPDNPTNWPWLAQLNPHVVASGIIYSADAEARTVVLDQIRYLYAIGDYTTSRKLAESAVGNWRASLGVNDEMTLVASRHLANALRELGDYTRAREINQVAFEGMRDVLGKEHEQTLAMANSVAADWRLLGDFDKARELDDENLSIYRRVIGEDDLATLRSANNLAIDHRLLGGFQDARALDEANVARRASLFGDDDPRTLAAYTGLIRDYIALGMYDRALSLQLPKYRALADRLDPYHIELLRAERNVAILLRKTGNFTEALDLARRNYESYRTRFGENNEQTFAAALTLCNNLRVMNEFEDALAIGNAAYSGYATTFNVAHPFAAVALVDLAVVLRLQGRIEDALQMNTSALAYLRERIGNDHPWSLCALNNQANTMAASDRPSEARALSEECLTRSRRVRGDDHPHTLGCAGNSALDLGAAGEHIEASALRRDTLARLRHALGNDHPDTIAFGLESRIDHDIDTPPL
jgi:tetratricopeptide (TPR) repeat protein